ncbi:MAG: hypothetical protein NC388_10980 [Clostridium sp.]|nr:hypothetical protein [Clostridium sp.]
MKLFSLHHTAHIAATLALTLTSLLTGCRREARLPEAFEQTDEQANLFPDYKDVTIPPNIAPLNFIVSDSRADGFIAAIQGDGGHLLTAAGKDGKICPDTTGWRQLLEANRGKELQVDLYAHREKGWVKYRSHTLAVADEPIDEYLSYRLIEPGYEYYRQLGLYQRRLSNFDVTAIYENNRTYDNRNNHCVNCHNYQNYSTERMLFHVRGNHSGTLVARDGRMEKIQIKNDSILSAGVYPSWHPTLPLIAFSTNATGQAFHLKHPEKIEVLDTASDLLLYDAEENTVKTILRSDADLETFPCWSPDGKTLYYCSARRPDVSGVPDSLLSHALLLKYDSLRYDVLRMTFDEKTRSFGRPDTVIRCSAEGHSASVPRISPDGRYLLYTQGDYGQFHIWHRSADLWVKDLHTDEPPYPLQAANSREADSYHTWSSNGRWVVMASRRGDRNYSRVYIAYFDRDGQARKAFLLPQEDPEQNILLLKSYNVPELTRNAVSIPKSDFHKVIYESEGTPIRFVPSPATDR